MVFDENKNINISKGTQNTAANAKASGMENTAVNGELTYEDKVIEKIIGIALENIDGLLTVDGGFFTNIAEKLVNTDNRTAGINAEVGKKQVAVDMDIVVEYGKDIEKIYEEMKELIGREVKNMTHLDVIEVNVNVADIKTIEEYEKGKETVQDKVTGAAKATGEKAKHVVDKGAQRARDNAEPRVE